MRHSRQILSILIFAFSAFTMLAENQGAAIMKRCADKFASAPSVLVNFAIASNDGSANGTLLMSKRMFAITTPDFAVRFDGKTQWTYFASAKEVDITEPTGVELMESNPFELITSFATNFNCRTLKSSPSNDIVELTPRLNDNPITNARITINKSTGWPTAMIITFDNGATTSVSISEVTVGQNVSAAQFKYSSKLFPGAKLVDLR